MITIGTTLTYKAFDEEYYSRGYGVQFETKQSTVDEIRYKVSSHYQDIGVNNIVSENKNPSVGDTVNFQFWDGEEGRSYGWVLARKEGTVSEVFYRMKNGDSVRIKDIKEVKG
jgi:hypothetical protein